MNVQTAIGNIGRSAEIRYSKNGDAVASFSFALTSGYGDNQLTTWLECSLWGKRAETLAPMLLKGTKVGITGELTNRPYTAKDGTEKHSLEVRLNNVTLLGSKPNPNDSDDPRNYETVKPAPKAIVGNEPMDFESDIPF